MAQIRWDESFSVNQPEIDEQHRKWIDIYNMMDRAMIEPDLHRQTEIIAGALEMMLDYTNSHFRFEEEFMRRVDYPDIVSHIRMHKDFDSLIYHYYRDITMGEPLLNTRLLKIIREWLFEHALVEDKKFCQFASNMTTKRTAKRSAQAQAKP